MKLRLLAILFAAILLTACNFSLAEDITPPPNYIPPTPAPTLGPMVPARAPDVDNGSAIYAAKCSACHGPTGMGDGDQGKQLPVTVAGLALPQVGRAASPAEWYVTVTRGNIERYMPPFNSLSEQERWDVVAYGLTLHATGEQVSRGQSLFESNCAACSLDFFKDQAKMTSLSADDLVLLLKNGNDQLTAIAGLADEELYAVAAYLRTLTFAAPSPTPEPPAATPTQSAPDATPSVPPAESETPAAAGMGTPGAEGTPIATEPAASPIPEPTGGRVTGSVTGDDIDGLTVTLRGYDHTSESSGPQEILTLTSITDSNGSFTFEGLDLAEGRILLAEVVYQGVTYASETAVIEAGASELVLPSFKLYPVTTDFSSMSFDQVHFFLEVAEGTVQVVGVYTFSNTGDRTIAVQSTTEIPFLKLPSDAADIGYDLTDNSAPIIAAEDGFAIQPSDSSYGLVAYYSIPYDKKAQITQPFALPAASILVLVPNGVKLKSDQLTEGDLQNFQGTDYRQFSGGPLLVGDSLTLNLSGMPKTSTSGTDSNQGLLIGIGALGLVLILAGVWMYLRDRNRTNEDLEEEPEEQDDFESEEEILDAIIALDDLHRSGKIPGEIYQTRRAELKARLKG